MIKYELTPQAKINFMDSLNLDDYQYIIKEGCLSDHILINKIDKPIHVKNSDLDINHTCDYIMILETAKTNMLGVAQYFTMFLFNKNEISDMVEKQNVFKESEIKYMEYVFDEEDDE